MKRLFFIVVRRWAGALAFAAVLILTLNLAGQTPLRNDAIVKLVKAGLAEDVIISTINLQPAQFALNPDDLIALKKDGVSDKIIAAMIAKAQAGSGTKPTSNTPASPAANPGPALTVAGVQAAVNQAVDWTKKGGAIIVTGIQEIPAQNEARADLQFSNFQYNANGFNNIPKPKNEVTPPDPNPNSPTFYQDMANIPNRERHVARYSGQGVGTIKHYSDGRWVLTQIDFNFLQITGNIAISNNPASQTMPSQYSKASDPAPAIPAPATLGSTANTAPAGPPFSFAGKWSGQINDTQGTQTITLTLGDNGTGSGSIVTAAVRGSSKTFPATAKLSVQGGLLSGTIGYSYKALIVPCNATMNISGRASGTELSGTYTAKSTCSTNTENGSVSLQRN